MQFVMTDENGDFRYLYANTTTLAMQSTAVPFADALSNRTQYFGTFIEFIGEDGFSIYRLTVNSSNVISITLVRQEPRRIEPIHISNGHLRPFDGINLYYASLMSIGSIEYRLQEVAVGFGGVSIPTIGTLTIQLADSDFDFLAGQSWDTRDIVIQAGLSTNPIQQYSVIMRAKTESAEWNLNEITISIRDQGILFDRSVQNNTYAGTGGYEGTEEMKGRVKPISLGHVVHATPALVDPMLNLYQFNDGPTNNDRPTNELIRIYEGGSAHFSLQLNTNLLAWQPSPQDVDSAICGVDLTRGFFLLLILFRVLWRSIYPIYTFFILST
jgi:hypothetical protein